ncbi:ankyrin repeat, PH and SEC7 domain containing protein secG-like [Sycon ciliatum]|uniref:ankyrin repeat, PH and SEC7 domain containing protein secG-like n=1 Tax=Sycon ciliatum TaxID=27933 RepID=UPI0031F6C6AB
MAAVNVERIYRYAREDKVEELKAEILEDGVLKEEIKCHTGTRGDPLLARLLKDACSHNATSVVKFLASTVDKHMLNHLGYYSFTLSTGVLIEHYGCALHEAVDRHSVKCLQYLLDAGADTNVTDHRGKTPLHFASERGHIDCMRHLLDSKANPNQPDERGKTPLQYASELGHIDCMRHLLDSKANPNQPDKDKRTPLHYGTIENNTDCVLHLLQAGANPDQGDKLSQKLGSMVQLQQQKCPYQVTPYIA